MSHADAAPGVGGAGRVRPFHIAVMATLVVVLALPGIVADTHAADNLSSVPPAFDRFLDAVRAATPPSTRILVVNAYADSHHYMYYRCVYALYPRGIALERVTSTDRRQGRLTVQWSYIRYVAHLNHARYILIWALPPGSPPQADSSGWALPSAPAGPLGSGAVVLRHGWGTLVDVGS